MIISKMIFPLYGIIVVLSVVFGMMYILFNLKKDRLNNKQISLYFMMYISFAFIGGKIYTVLVYDGFNILTAGLSAYGGLIGVVVAAILFEKILDCDGRIIKYTILSLPLVYGLTKIGCFISGCCSGIPYDGFLKIKYVDVLNIWQFPIQMVEVIIFLIIFFVCNYLKKYKNTNYITMFLVIVLKFLLDFLRYDHVDVLISRNQVISIILLIIVIVVYIIKNKRLIKYIKD